MKALIFDMDGLMIDSERLYFKAEREIAAEFGRTVKEETLWRMMGRKPSESIEIFVRETGIPRQPHEILSKRDELMREMLQTDLAVMPGLLEILPRFFGRLKMAIATGAPRKFLDIVVDQLEIRPFFAVLQCSDEIERGKPHPEIYLRTCEKLDCPPEDAIVLEDSSNGAMAGKRAGCHVLAVPTEYTNGQDFSFVEYTAADLFEAADHIESLLIDQPVRV